MTKVLFTDYDFLDHSIEQAISRRRGHRPSRPRRCRTEDELIAAAQDCDALLLQYAPFTARVAAALPRLGLVSRMGAGFDTIDTDACARHGIWVSNSPDYGVGEVATHALGMALAMIRNIVAYHRDIGEGKWHFTSSGKLRRASDMTLGIVGLGRIGKRMAHIGRNVFRDVIACDPYVIDGDFPAYVERATHAEVFEKSDVVSLHVPLNAETRGMVGADAPRPGATGRLHRQHRARRRARRRRGVRGAGERDAAAASRSTCCRSSRCPPTRSSSVTRG